MNYYTTIKTNKRGRRGKTIRSEKEIKENNNKSLFGNFTPINSEKDNKEEKDNNKSLFGGTSLFNNEKGIDNHISLFGDNSEKNDNNKKIGLFDNIKEEEPNKEMKEEKKEKLNLYFFTNNNKPESNVPSLFGNNYKDNKIKASEEPKSNISSKAAGSLATTSNPFLNPNTPNPVENVFNAEIILNSIILFIFLLQIKK